MAGNEEGKNGMRSFAKYSAISFQMLATIGVLAFAGYKLDAYRQSKSLVFTAIFSLLGVVISLYQVIRQLNNADK